MDMAMYKEGKHVEDGNIYMEGLSYVKFRGDARQPYLCINLERTYFDVQIPENMLQKTLCLGNGSLKSIE